MRIALSGGQGLGKTTLAKTINENFNIPFIQADTRSFMPKGIKSHKDILGLSVNSPQECIDFQSNLINARYDLFKNTKGSFISDRGVMDSYVYYSMHNSMFDTDENSKYLLEKTLESLQYTDFIISFDQQHDPYRQSDRDNGVRFTNKSYLKQVNNSIKYQYLILINSFYSINSDYVHDCYTSKEVNGMSLDFQYIEPLDSFFCIFTERYYNNEVNRALYLYETLKTMYNNKQYIGSPLEDLDVTKEVMN